MMGDEMCVVCAYVCVLCAYVCVLCVCMCVCCVCVCVCVGVWWMAVVSGALLTLSSLVLLSVAK